MTLFPTSLTPRNKSNAFQKRIPTTLYYVDSKTHIMDKTKMQQEFLEMKAKIQEKMDELQKIMEETTDEAREEYKEQAEKVKAFAHEMGGKLEKFAEEAGEEAAEEWTEFKETAQVKLNALRERLGEWISPPVK